MIKKTLQLYKVVAHNTNDESVDYTARWHIVARNVADALRKVKPLVERGEEVMSVERITSVGVL